MAAGSAAWHNLHLVLILRRARRPLAILCVAVVAFTVFAPGVTVVDAIAPPPDYVLLPQLEPLDTVTAAPVGVEQPQVLRSALPERAPPAARAV